MAARVLSDYFNRVTVFERDQIEDRPAIHKSIPQGNDVHTLLIQRRAGDVIAVSRLYRREIEEGWRGTPMRPVCRFRFLQNRGQVIYGHGLSEEPRDLGLVGHTMSRGLLKHLIRHRVSALGNVKLEKGVAVEGLLNGGRRIRGVRAAAGSRSVEADLVVDAGGRSSHAAGMARRDGDGGALGNHDRCGLRLYECKVSQERLPAGTAGIRRREAA